MNFIAAFSRVASSTYDTIWYLHALSIWWIILWPNVEPRKIHVLTSLRFLIHIWKIDRLGPYVYLFELAAHGKVALSHINNHHWALHSLDGNLKQICKNWMQINMNTILDCRFIGKLLLKTKVTNYNQSHYKAQYIGFAKSHMTLSCK